MAPFKQSEFDIKGGEAKPGEVRVIKMETGGAPVIRDFSLNKVSERGHGDYAAVKHKFGALAATDEERHYKSRKDSRFALSELQRDPLSVDEEERRVIEEKVRARVAAVADEAKAQAAEVGYQDGLKKGHEEAFKRFQQEGAQRLQQFEAFLAECEAAKSELFRANERFLIEMVFRIAKMVLLKELSADQSYVLRLAKELVERVGVRENIRLKISSAEMETAGMLKEKLDQAFGGLKNLNIEASAQVQGGGCMVETEWNAIDASVETQLKGIYDALTGGAK